MYGCAVLVTRGLSCFREGAEGSTGSEGLRWSADWKGWDSMKNEMHVTDMERMFSMQLDFLSLIRNLIIYDKEHSEEPERTKFLEGFCDTQEKALDMAVLLLNKHKKSLLAEEKAKKDAEQKAKKEEQAKTQAERKKEAEEKAIEADLEKAKNDEDSLFAGLE